MTKKIFSFIILSLFIISCSQPQTGVVESQYVEKEKEDSPFIEGNKKIVMLEEEEIALFLKRYEWNMMETGSGLRFEITEEGSGDYPEKNEEVTLQYKTYLLTGDEVYNSEVDGEITFKVQKTEQMIGLHEAVMLMKKGSSARIILPSHLAFGLSGDGNKIKSAKPIIMLIKLLDNDIQ